MYKSKGICGGIGRKQPTTNVTGCKAYSTWANMIKRCYGKGYVSYNEVDVCDDWKKFK